MTIEFDLWKLITLLVAGIGGAWSVGKIVAAQAQRGLDRQFAELKGQLERIDATGRAEAENWKRVERELLNLKAELPLHYVRREDYVQAIATIMAKLDSMALRFENLILKGENRER